MKKQTTKKRLVLERQTVRAIGELRESQLVDVQGGMYAGTCRGCGGCTEAESGCGIVTA